MNSRAEMTPADIEARVRALGTWFHNIDLKGVKTAPNHFLGDYPAIKWRHFADALPTDVSGRTVLDIGCNAGFYSIEMKRRGAARVVGIEPAEEYLEQARFAAEMCEVDIELHRLSVYDVAKLGEKFDIILFMGVFYHLRHPLLALDLIHDHVAKDILVFQSMLRGSDIVEPIDENYPFRERGIFERPGFPRMSFIEQRYADDETNWWIPNRACAEAVLRSSGFEIVNHPEEEVFICRRINLPDPPEGPRAVYPAKGAQE
ncbi:MAG TPA: TIGR04290 family methyltransferase [Alphaproteobacteria bacterium]